MTDGTTAWSMTYDADGLRTKRVTSTGSHYYYYYYENGLLTGMEFNGSILRFTYDAQGRPVSVSMGSTTYFYALNLQGDVMAIVDEDGNPVTTYTYNAWGKLISGSGSMYHSIGVINPLRYRGYVYHRETGLYYLQSRYYNPEICRFISPDDVSLIGANDAVISHNLYAYCSNNPISREDSDGHFWAHIFIGAGVGAIAGFVGQVISDVVTSVINQEVTISNWQTYAGAIVGGMAGGATLAATGSVDIANTVTGAVTTGVGQTLEKLTIADYDKSWAEIGANSVADGAISFGLGKLPGIKGVTAGRNNQSAVYRSGLTKLRHGNASRMSRKVFTKGISSNIVGGFALDGYYGIKQHAYDRVKALLP